MGAQGPLFYFIWRAIRFRISVYSDKGNCTLRGSSGNYFGGYGFCPWHPSWV